MKKKLIITVAIMLILACLVSVLAACSSTKGLSFKKAKISIDYDPAVTFASQNVAEITALSGKSYQSSSNNGILVVLSQLDNENNTVRTLYNVETNTVLVTDTADQISLYNNDNNTYYLRSSFNAVSGMYSTVLYNAKGEEIKYVDAAGAEQSAYVSADIPAVAPVSDDVVVFADNYFRVPENGNTVQRIGRVSNLVNFNYNFTASNDKYYYQIDANRGKAYIFDKKLNLVTTYYAHGQYNNISINVLQSGDLLVQTVTQLMDEEKDYTYINNGTKYLLKTYVVKAKNGKVTEKKFKYLVNILLATSDDDDVKIKADNIALLYPIKDKRLLRNNNDAMAVSLSNSLKVKGRIDQMIDNQVPGDFPNAVNNYLVISTPIGQKLVTTGGKVIGDFAYDNHNDSLFTLDGKIYDYKLKMLFDYEVEGYEYSSMMNNSIILTKYVDGNLTYYRFDGEMTAPKQLSTATIGFGKISKYLYYLRAVVDGNNVYTYYNEKDEVVTGFATSTAIQNTAANAEKECFLYRASIYDATLGRNVTHYYRVAK